MLTYESLPCKLTDDEVLDKTKLLTTALNHEDELEARLASFKESHKEAATHAAYETRKLRTIVAERIEYREVEVQEVPDYKRGVVEVLRVDTNEMVRHRAMNETERQMPLAASEGKRKKKGAEAEAAE